MLIRRPPGISSAEITPEALYVGRREFLQVAGLAALGGLAGRASPPAPLYSSLHGIAPSRILSGQEELTPYKDIAGYNNYYEFGTGKDDPAKNATNFRVKPWTVEIAGEVKRPATYNLDDLLRGHTVEERVYRLRCVEGWSMVIPWLGIPLGRIIDRLEPTSRAKYVEFTTILDPKQMPGQQTNILPWPYVEGLRMDEARHPLTILVTGLYGKPLPNQNGAPLRLAVPWKYGFKSGKAIVKIRFLERQPATTWNISAPTEYGFYANVNPEVDHPRWSQARERRIGDFFKRKTLMFNGYADEVAGLYAGMDLRKNF